MEDSFDRRYGINRNEEMGDAAYTEAGSAESL